MPDYTHRSTAIEVMDDLECSGQVVDQSLRELEIINRLLGGNSVTVSGIKFLLARSTKQEPTIVDLGCGGGDMLNRIAEWGRRNKIRMKLTGVDANPNIVTFAKNNSASYPEINYETVNIFDEHFRKRRFDIYVCTLFTHHFTDRELAGIFNWLQRQSNIGVVINDIHRHWFAFHSIRLLTRFFSKSTMVQSDAPLSVLRAFRRKELMMILDLAGVKQYTLRWRWAFRWQLIFFGA